MIPAPTSRRQVCLKVAIATVLHLQVGYAFGSNNDKGCSVQTALNDSQNGLASVDRTPILEQAHQIAMIARQLEDTQQVLQYQHFARGPSEGFRYRTFVYGMLFAWTLAAFAALLGWECLRHHLQRKQQAAVVGGLKNMDDDTLKKVLGKVSIVSDVCVSCNVLHVKACQCSTTISKAHLILGQLDQAMVPENLPWLAFDAHPSQYVQTDTCILCRWTCPVGSIFLTMRG